MSDELIALRKFLDGSAPLDGYWFSEKRPDVPGAFWWRHDLTAIDRAAAELATLRATITRLESDRDRYRAAVVAADGLRDFAQRYSDGDKAVPWVIVRDALYEWAQAHDATISAALQEPKA